MVQGIFVHPPWVPNCIQKFEVGLKIFISHFPFDSYRDLFSNVFTILCVFQWTWLLKEICGVSYCRLISTATPMNTKKKEFASLFLWGKNWFFMIDSKLHREKPKKNRGHKGSLPAISSFVFCSSISSLVSWIFSPTGTRKGTNMFNSPTNQWWF